MKEINGSEDTLTERRTAITCEMRKSCGARIVRIVMRMIFVQEGDTQMCLFQMMVFAIREKGESDG